MSAPDELAEMKRYITRGITWSEGITRFAGDGLIDVVRADDADRVIAARDARIAELTASLAIAKEAAALAGDFQRELASRDAEIAEAREIIANFKGMVEQVPEFNHRKYVSFGIRVNNFLTPPSQAPEARRDVGGVRTTSETIVDPEMYAGHKRSIAD